MRKKKLSRTGQCLGMGIYTTNASRNLHEAWWSLDKGQVVSSHRFTQRAAQELNHLKDVDGVLSKRASKIEKNVKHILKSFVEIPNAPKGHDMKVGDKAKVKKGIVEAIVQVQKLRESVAKTCGLPKELLRP